MVRKLTQDLGRKSFNEISCEKNKDEPQPPALSRIIQETYSFNMRIGGKRNETLKNVLNNGNTPSPPATSDERFRRWYPDE